MTETSDKRLLWTLSLLTFLSFSFIGTGIYLISHRRLRDINSSLPDLLLIIIIFFLAFVAFNLFIIAISVTKGRRIAHAEALRKIFFRFFYPAMVILARIAGISREKTQQIFIDANNILVRSNPRYVKPERLLVLLPHCLQFNECDIRITWDVYKCAGCGKCEIKDLVEIAKEANIHLSVATGGGIARKIVDEKKPEAIIAVACERDLSSGIMDSYPLPVLGIINKRPFGPCFNTMVELEDVKEALRYFTGL